MVAAAKMRRAQENMEQSRPYTSKLNNMLNSLIPEIDRSILPELERRTEIDHKLFVVITADRGLAGAFNSNVIKMAQKEIDKFGRDKSVLICIGKKSLSHFKSRKYNIIEDYIDFWSELGFQHAISMGEKIISHFISGEADEVQIIYNKFINVGKQEVQHEKSLPLTYESQDKSSSIPMDRIYEPSKASVVKAMVPKY